MDFVGVVEDDASVMIEFFCCFLFLLLIMINAGPVGDDVVLVVDLPYGDPKKVFVVSGDNNIG